MTALFLGDSHTCGYKSASIEKGADCSSWNDNNYAEFYALENNIPTKIYAMPGSCNSLYPDWLKTMFDMDPSINEVYVLLSSWNRFILAYNRFLSKDVLPSNFFTKHYGNKHSLVDIFYDVPHREDRLQLLNKPTSEDYVLSSLEFDDVEGLKNPDIRKDNFMQIKLFFDLNTHIEQRSFFKDLLVMDTMCTNQNCKLYLFHMTDRLVFPDDVNFYTQLKSTTLSTVSIETFFKKRFIDHKRFYLDDSEHYNEDYHKLIATKFIPWIKNK